MVLNTFHERFTAAGHRFSFLALHAPDQQSIPDWTNRAIVRRSGEELRAENLTRFRAISALIRE